MSPAADFYREHCEYRRHGMPGPERTGATDQPAASLSMLKAAARENQTINMVIAKFEVFERPIHALSIDNRPARPEDLD